ncbi:hypothetical protein GCM10010420_56680 [Streptomyces glaucosporus]|uniref:Uncharacterized protein n=1 Tax=Streptomyces glaucosporus TaxID=284044 RepID=A0ABN3J007_9ACTN
MLASTVQFSNNDQPPITPEPRSGNTGAGTEDPAVTAVPSDTQQRAQLPADHRHRVPRLFTEEAVLAFRPITEN